VVVEPEESQLSFQQVGGESVLRKLRGLDPNSMTPMEALSLIYELKKEADGQ
jgi:hypothetical protein